MSFDLAILGAGPAGAAAAVEASALGLSTVIFDEQPVAGGQVYRASPGIASGEADGDVEGAVEGEGLRRALDGANVERRFAHRVWSIERGDDGFRIDALGPAGASVTDAKALIVATGALERYVPFAGWDLPGVMGLASATILLKSQRILPGRNVVVAGAGPLLYAVANGIIEGGGDVAAIVDAQPRSAWWGVASHGVLSRPDLVLKGASWLSALRRARVSILRGQIVRAVVRSDSGEGLRASVGRIGDEGRGAGAASIDGPAIDCDALCCGFGLLPSTDVTRLLGATHAFDASLGGWHVVIDDDQRCDVPGLYAAGDVAGVTGAAAAPWQGRIAAQAAAVDLGRRVTLAGKRERARAARFGVAMTRIAQVGDGAIAAIPPEVTMCLCEGLSRDTLEAAIADGCTTVNDLKRVTRCGMGPCGGRICEDPMARLIALKTGRSRAEVGQATGRPPLRPVGLDEIAGDFDYEALPLPAPAPL